MPSVTAYRVLGLFQEESDFVDLEPFEISPTNIDQSESLQNENKTSNDLIKPQFGTEEEDDASVSYTHLTLPTKA